MELLSAEASIHEDYACMLNQTDVMHNNNKFYVIQLAISDDVYHLYTRWGRVGETGQYQSDEFEDEKNSSVGR